jgi:hypothetical protein
MQAIITKFLCPTNFRGSRYQAKCEAMTVTVAADHALNAEENHLAVCKAAQWTKPKASGQIPSGEYVHVFLPVEVLA